MIYSQPNTQLYYQTATYKTLEGDDCWHEAKKNYYLLVPKTLAAIIFQPLEAHLSKSPIPTGH